MVVLLESICGKREILHAVNSTDSKKVSTTRKRTVQIAPNQNEELPMEFHSVSYIYSWDCSL